jgi:hypothetical protein
MHIFELAGRPNPFGLKVVLNVIFKVITVSNYNNLINYKIISCKV